MQIYSTTYASPIGTLKLSCSDTALLSIEFDTEEHLTDRHIILETVAKQLSEYFSGSRTTFDLHFAQSGSSFQQKVWELLYQIPFGKTISYQQLSKQYGDVKAIRAIASANGRNNLPIIVPCHRIIGSNQSLTGYSGGLWRKQWLLTHEAKLHSGVQVLF